MEIEDETILVILILMLNVGIAMLYSVIKYGI